MLSMLPFSELIDGCLPFEYLIGTHSRQLNNLGLPVLLCFHLGGQPLHRMLRVVDNRPDSSCQLVVTR
jgi:hypothetical protein